MPKLYMFLIGCTPPERNIEQHDVFFGIGDTINELVPAVQAFWPGLKKMHFDAWREVTWVDGHRVTIVLKEEQKTNSPYKLFFLNLGGYKPGEFEEFHYKMLVAASDKTEAISMAKQTAFFRHTGFNDANSHIDDKYGVDVDDVYEIGDILPKEMKDRYNIVVTKDEGAVEDELHLGYFKLSTFQ